MAIAFDAASEDKTTTGDTLTYAHSCTGSDRFLWVAVTTVSKATPSITTATYGGTAMTQLETSQLVYATTNWYHWVFYLKNPASGSNNVVITASPSGGSIRSGCVSYTGVHQTSPINVSNKGGGTGSPMTLTSTSTAAGWWIMSGANIDAAFAAGSITDTLRVSYVGLADIADSAGDESAGSTTTTMTFSGTRNWGGIHALIVPSSASSGNIKKINNIAWANVKKVNNIAVANIKKINGIAAK